MQVKPLPFNHDRETLLEVCGISSDTIRDILKQSTSMDEKSDDLEKIPVMLRVCAFLLFCNMEIWIAKMKNEFLEALIHDVSKETLAKTLKEISLALAIDAILDTFDRKSHIVEAIERFILKILPEKPQEFFEFLRNIIRFIALDLAMDKNESSEKILFQ